MWKWVLGASIATIVFYAFVQAAWFSSELLIAIVGGIFSVAFFWNQSHRDNAQFAFDLIRYFNDRYDNLNDKLLTISEGAMDEPLRDDEKRIVIDYFNLCAEEWLFYSMGYIYQNVWNSWYNGMKQYGSYPFVIKLWQKEAESNSYYGFAFPVVKENAR